MAKSDHNEVFTAGKVRKLRRAGVITRKGRGGQTIYQSRNPRRRNQSALQKAWQADFRQAAADAKQAGTATYNQAKAFADSDCAGLTFWRDYLGLARAGKLISGPVSHPLARNPLLSVSNMEGEIYRVTTPTANVSRTAFEALTAGVWKSLTPNNLLWDTNAFWDASGDPTHLTAKSQGLYMFGAEVRSNTTTGTRRIITRYNITGYGDMYRNEAVPPTGYPAHLLPTGVWYFNPGDQIEIQALCNASGNTVLLHNFWIVGITPETIVLP